MSATQTVLVGLALFTLVVAVADFRTGHIPNRLVAIGAILGAVVHFGVHALLLRRPGEPLRPFLLGAAANLALGFLACSLVPLLLFRLRAMGGGDVKTLAVVGVWVGPVLGVQIEMFAMVGAAIYALATLAYRGQLLRVIGNSAALAANPFLPKASRRALPPALLTEIRFGPALWVAVVLVSFLRWRTG